MGETISVRDHAKPCEHGSLWAHWVKAAEAKWWQPPECLGGREMLLEQAREGLWAEVETKGEVSGRAVPG